MPQIIKKPDLKNYKYPEAAPVYGMTRRELTKMLELGRVKAYIQTQPVGSPIELSPALQPPLNKITPETPIFHFVKDLTRIEIPLNTLFLALVENFCGGNDDYCFKHHQNLVHPDEKLGTFITLYGDGAKQFAAFLKEANITLPEYSTETKKVMVR